MGWHPDRWQWIDEGHFLDYTTKDGRDSIINRNPGTTRAVDKWQGYLPGNLGFIGPKFGTHCGQGKKLRSSNQSSITRLRSMNGGHVLHHPLSLSNVSLVSLTLANRPSINFGTASKQEGHGDGPHLLCMNFVGSERATTTVSTGNKLCSGKGSLKSMGNRLKCGTSLDISQFGPFGLNATTRCLIRNNGMNLKLNKRYGMAYHVRQSGLEKGDGTYQNEQFFL